MHLDELRTFCLAFPEAAEGFPFGPDPLVFKVGRKMFALMGLDDIPPRVVLKCDPERTVELRERYASISDGPHFRNLHWNYVRLDGSLSGDFVRDLVEHSYRLVVAKLKKADRTRIVATEGYPAASHEEH